MTKGFREINPGGEEFIMFLDLIGCDGGVPALNSSIDFMSQNLNVCCHLCNYLRKTMTEVELARETIPCAGRYSDSSVHGAFKLSRSESNRHSAIRAYDVDDIILQQLGMKRNIDDNICFFQ